MEPGVYHYRANELVDFAIAVLTSPNFCKDEQKGFPRKQAEYAAKVLVEADLRGDPAHGLAGGSSLDDILEKVNDDRSALGFKRIEIAEYAIEKPNFDWVIPVDAKGTLGHYVAMDILPKVIETAKTKGIALALISNSTHFGDCGIYAEEIAKHGLCAEVTCTSPQWTKAYVESIDGMPGNYKGSKKRFGTNPIALSVPYNEGIVTIDMAATQRAVSPALDVAKKNKASLKITSGEDGLLYVGIGSSKAKLKDVHLEIASLESPDKMREKLRELGYPEGTCFYAVEKGLLLGPDGQSLNFPLAFDDIFKQDFWIAPLGGTYFGYKGFGLNTIIDLKNVIAGGATGLIRQLDPKGKPTTPERVSQTILAMSMGLRMPEEEARARVTEAINTTIACSNKRMKLPGQKEHEESKKRSEEGIPYDEAQVEKLISMGESVGVPFNLIPIKVDKNDNRHALSYRV